MALNGSIVVAVGGSDSSTPASSHNGNLKACNNLTKRMGFATADYHRSATQLTNQPTNPPVLLISPLKAALFLGETATMSAELHWVHCFTVVQWQQLNTSWHTHFHAHMQHLLLDFSLDVFLETFCVITRIFLRFGLYTWGCQYASL